jgi:formate dehydrogenase subunit gamma
MEQRTIERFRKRAILIHWLHAASSVVLMITGAIMFFNLTGMSGGQQIRIIHKIAAVFFVAIPVLFVLFDPKAALSFLKEAFRWDRDDIAWLRASVRFYFGRKTQMPHQGYINGDQKLWQLVVITSGFIFMLTGIMMWFFKLKMPWILYRGILLTHDIAFMVVLLAFIVHFYLTTLHPRFEESLSSMVDGKVSLSYAQKHYTKWYKEKTGGQ